MSLLLALELQSLAQDTDMVSACYIFIEWLDESILVLSREEY